MLDRPGRGYFVLLVTVAAIWGASFLFIKVADRRLEPSFLIELRLVLSALVLLPVLFVRRGAEGLADLRAVAKTAVLLGIFNSAMPFTLIAWGETHIDSGVAAVGNASTPIFVALLAIPFLESERSSGWKLAGIMLGLAGVAVLTGASPGSGWWAVLGTLAVILAAFLYAASVIWLQPRFPAGREVALVTGSMLSGAVVLLPLALVQAPSHVWPGWKAAGSVVALAVGGTCIALLLYYEMLRRYGSARASLVTYLMPVAALFYGVGLLGEPLRAAEVGGLALILAGVGLGSGAVRSWRRAPAPT